jgi:aspartyl-tRNA(Asn)/glutamyl-tRNA(Gln) amidotransferase subunit B
LPELPSTKIERYVAKLGLSDYDARVLTDDSDVARFFEEALAAHDNAKAVANWVINDLLGALKGRSLTRIQLRGKDLGELVQLIDDQTISGKIAKDLFPEFLEHGGSPRQLVEKRGLQQLSDIKSIEAAVDRVLAENPDAAAKYKAGKTNIVGFLVGLVMKSTGGKANPKVVSELLVKKLS